MATKVVRRYRAEVHEAGAEGIKNVGEYSDKDEATQRAWDAALTRQGFTDAEVTAKVATIAGTETVEDTARETVTLDDYRAAKQP